MICDLQVAARNLRVLEESSEEGIASNILADRLRRLVSAGLLTRADVGRGRRATYGLTEAAIEPGRGVRCRCRAVVR